MNERPPEIPQCTTLWIHDVCAPDEVGGGGANRSERYLDATPGIFSLLIP
jgi:hypothetical protein